MTKSLLEHLQERMECAYLSDLLFLDYQNRQKLFGILDTIPIESFSLHEWADTLSYLTARSRA